MSKSSSKRKINYDKIFENSYTKLYEKVKELNTPANYIIYINNDGKESFKTLKDIFIEESTEDLYTIYSKYSEKFSFKDFICSYFYSMYNESISDLLFTNINEAIDSYNTEEDNITRNFAKYENYDDFIKDVRIWLEKYTREFEKDKIIRDKIINTIEKLSETEAIDIELENIDIKNLTYEFIPHIELERETFKITKKEKNIKVDPKIGILVFNNMKCSYNVPFIQLNNYDGIKYYKIYESDTFRDIGKIIDFTDDKPDTFFFKVLLQGEEIESNKKSSYITCKYNLKNGKLSFSCQQEQQDDIKRKLNECYNLFNISRNIRTYNIQGQILVKNQNIDASVLHFLILNEYEINLLDGLGIFNTYFYINEVEKTIADKTLELKFKSASQIDSENCQCEKDSSITLKFENKGDDLIINFTKAESDKVLQQFIEVFRRIVTIYNENSSFIKEFIDGFIEDEIDIENYDIKENTKIPEKKIKQLRETFLNIAGTEEESDLLFSPGSTGYTRICECKKQPIILTDKKDIDDWKSRKFNYKNEQLNRQVGSFPPDKPLFSFICPDDQYPFPSVAKNNDVNSDKYPYVPCCAKTDEINNPKSNYNNYRSVKEVKDAPNKNYKINTMKHLGWDRTGEISTQIQNLLDSTKIEDEKYKFERYGVGLSINSMIHCILKALNDRKYIEQIGYDKKEEYCDNIRKDITNTLPNFYELIRQEVFDYTKAEIITKINDRDEYFSSALFYRIFEELYNVNIYVILYKENIFNKESKDEDPAIEIPKNSLMHIRPKRNNRKTIILLKHMGGEMESLKYPVYDLIFNTGVLLKNATKNVTNQDRRYIFGNDMNEIMYKSLINFNRNYIFSINKSIIESREYPYSQVNWENIFKDFIIESQTLDTYGKCRSLNLLVKNTDIKLTVYITPSQPLNLPESKKIYQSDTETVIGIFDTPTKAIETGLWFKVIDYDYGVFIPCKTNSKEKCPESPVINTDSSKNNPITSFRNIQKYSKMLLDCIKWGLRSNNILNLEDYLDNYSKFLIVDEKVRPNILPIKNRSYITEKGNFSYLSNIWPEYFKNDNTVHLYPELYDTIVRHLAIYYKNTDGLSLKPEPYLSEIFQYEWDFNNIEQTRILIGDNHLKKWLEIKETDYKGKLQIYNEINIEALSKNPKIPILYNYKNEDINKMYMIQSTCGYNKQSSLNCAYNWKINKFNLGFDTSNIKKNEIPHMIFNISTSYQLIVTDKKDINFKEGESYVEILRLSENNYVALLELY